MNLPVLFRVALALLALSFVLFLAGFASSSWIKVSQSIIGPFRFGLWTVCIEGLECQSYSDVLGYSPGGHVYVGRVCGIIQLALTLASLVLLLVFAFKLATQSFAKSAYSCAISAGIIGFLGAVVFIGREMSADSTGYLSAGWSGILVIIAAFIQIGAGVCILLPVKRGQLEYATS